MRKFMLKMFSVVTLITVANFVIDVFGKLQQANACWFSGGEIDMPKSLIK